MSSWELDPALFLAPQFQVKAPAEELACVLCCSPASDQPHTICLVDVNPTSRTYSEVIGEIALEQAESLPFSIRLEEEVPSPAIRAEFVWEPDLGQPVKPRVLLAHDPTCQYGFVSSGFSRDNLSSAISVWHHSDDPSPATPWCLTTVLTIEDEPHLAEQLPGLLQQSGAVPALITGIDLSPDDRFLYVACWGTGDLKQFDVADPLRPREVASVRIGGIAARAAHPSQARGLNGGPATVTVSRDGRRVYLTNALSRSWDAQLYPDGLQGWMVKLDVDPGAGISCDPNFFVDFGDLRPFRVYLPDQG